ncbi:MAG: hypothetical protein DBY35_12545 [Bacteroidales bacterium]|nr:MAG: hypothetical protein DBY35_12545 [Bacteroidales bacterium]
MSNIKSTILPSWSKYLLILVSSILLAWLLVPIIDLITNKIVGPFTELLPSGNNMIDYLVSMCVCIVCITIIIYIRKLKPAITNWITAIYGVTFALSIILAWGFDRFISNKWHFLPLFGTSVAIVDVCILTLFIVLTIIAFYNLRGKQNKKGCQCEDNENSAKEDSMQSDRPIQNEVDDKLQRSPFAKKLINKIENLDTSEGARSLAITASWGNGKTSFLNLVKNGLQKDKYYIVDIIPWNLNPEKSITAHFFEEIIKAFGGIDNQIARYLKQYSDMLASVNLGFFSSIFSNISLPAMAQKISEAMINRDIKVVVVFDDIDRLEASEIEEVFRIIRGSANFKNFIFISAFDKRYVQQALQNSNAAFNEHYIEKFFEMEFPLPEIRKDRIESIILDNISWMSEKDQTEFQKYITHDTSWMGGVSPYAPLTNLRIIYRWLNSLKYKYEILREECVISDLADLEMLNLLYPQVYTLLASEYETFFECESYQNTYKLWDESMKVSSESDWIRHQKQKTKRNLLNHCKDEFKMSSVQIQRLNTILERIVPKHRYHGEPKAFSNPNYTQRYFDSILAQTDIPQSKFDDMVAGKESYKEFIENDKDQIFSHSLLLMCFEFRPKNLNELRNLLEIIFYAFCHYDRFGLSYYTIRDKMYSFDLSKEDKKTLFSNLIINNKFSNHVYMSLIPSSYSERQGWLDIFSKEECNHMMTILFDKAIEEGYSVDELSTLYYYAKEKDKEEDVELSYVCKIEKIKNTYKKILAQSTLKNLSYLIYTQHPDDNKFYPSTDFVQLWGDWDSFNSYMNELGLVNEQASPADDWIEFETFIKEWESNNKVPIPFSFNHINISKN